MLGAIIIAESFGTVADDATRLPGARSTSWASVDLLGRPVIARVADQLQAESCDAVFVTGIEPEETGFQGKNPHQATDAWEGVSTLVANLRQEAFETVLIIQCGAYVEFDVAGMLAFHREHDAWLTRAVAPDGPLNLWMINPSRLPENGPLLPALQAVDAARYETFGYVNRLQSAYDFRRLALDIFSARCKLRPHGAEVKPGVWVCEGAQIERSARLVAPAFIGRDVLVSDHCLITRGSNIERNSKVDFGTAVEDSSILPNSYVGIGLDLTHSIVHGCNLLNLRHNVSLEITDPVVMRQQTDRNGNRSWADFERSDMALSSAE